MTGFTPDVRDTIRAGVQSSAAVIVPLLLDLFPHVRSVVDVGCGEGWFLAEFQRAGLTAVGIDHPDTEVLAVEPHDVVARDLGQRLTVHGCDLALCLEVAEHLPADRAPGLVADLCVAAPVVAFSAAIPGQGGTQHVNEQWPAYWADLFAAEGYIVSGALRWDIWDDERVEPWYRQNLLVAYRRNEAPGIVSDSPPRAVVHPILWESYRGSGE